MAIEIKNLTKKIGSATVLSDVNLTMNNGKIYGLKGKNGSGKTMLMRVISSLISPTEGEVVIDGKLLGKDMSFPESIGIKRDIRGEDGIGVDVEIFRFLIEK